MTPPDTPKCTEATASGARCKRSAHTADRCKQHAVAAGLLAAPVRDMPHRPGARCGCETPRLTVSTDAGTFDAEPCDALTPLCALYVAACLNCGGTYPGPWRRVREAR